MDKHVVKTTLAEINPLITDCFRDGLSVTFTVTGNSMQPFLQHNRDQVVLIKPEAGKLEKWDIPLYIRTGGQYVLHRIVDVQPGSYTLLGDAQTALEKGIRPEQIVGVAQGFIRKGRYIDCQSRSYRLWVSLWWHLRHIRPTLLRVYWIICRLLNGKQEA